MVISKIKYEILHMIMVGVDQFIDIALNYSDTTPVYVILYKYMK